MLPGAEDKRPVGAGCDPRKLVSLSLITAVGLILFSVETSIPRPLPWMRLGLANIAPLLALVFYGGWEAAGVMAAKVVVGGLLSGCILGPSFLLASAGGCAAVCCMSVAHRVAGSRFSVVGISVIGSASHNLTQLAVAGAWLIGPGAAAMLAPFFLLSGLVAGLLVGLVAQVLLLRLEGCRLWTRTGAP